MIYVVDEPFVSLDGETLVRGQICDLPEMSWLEGVKIHKASDKERKAFESAQKKHKEDST